jgi:hypothetical protein
MVVYIALTAAATLGIGEHYLVDLVAGVPFALFVQAVVWPGDKPRFTDRAITAASGLALTLVWLMLVRFGAKWMLVSPILPWALIVATGAIVWFVRVRFSALPNRSRPANDGTLAQPLTLGAHG